MPGSLSTTCCCGAWLFAESEDRVPEVVREHNATARHRQWRLSQDLPVAPSSKRGLDRFDPYEGRLFREA